MFKILRKLSLVAVASLALLGGLPIDARAVTCIPGSLPNTLVNGTTADATQVMANYNFIINSVNSGCLAAANNLSDVANPAVALSNLGGLGLSGGNLTGSLNFAKAPDLASASTVNLGAAAGNYANITGTTTITAFDTVQAGTFKIVTFTGSLQLTYNAVSMILPGAANITTAAGDVAMFVSLGSGNWTCISYQRASGTDTLDPLTVAHGGTGLATFSTHSVPVATAATTLVSKVIPDCTDTGGNHINYTQASDAWSCGTSSSGAGAIKSVTSQIFKVNGTYTPHAGMVYALIECIGGGGGGGGVTGQTSSQAASGGGGGAGSYSATLATAATVGASQTVTIGTAGTAGSVSNGGNGGDTSVGTICIGKGGSGGQTQTFSATAPRYGGTPGAGGIAGTGDITTVGDIGGQGLVFSVSLAWGGTGGASFYGAGSNGGAAASGGGFNGTAAPANSGAGGSGAAGIGNAGNANGGAGGTGIVRITEFNTQ